MRAIITSVILIAFILTAAAIGWYVLIKIDAHADDARILRGEAPREDDRNGLSRWLYLRTLRRAREQRELRARRQAEAQVRHGGE